MTEDNGRHAENNSCDCGGSCGSSGGGNWIGIILAVAVASVLVAIGASNSDDSAARPAACVAGGACCPGIVTVTSTVTVAAGKVESKSNTLPKLVDLGSVSCIPCKLMAPILDEMKTNYAGKLDVEFIDVVQKPAEGKKYAIKLIPTQIFIDASGKEFFRHEGFYSKDEILKKWKEIGVDLGSTQAVGQPEQKPLVRDEPLVKDSRPADQACSMCERSIDARTRVTADAPWGKANLCSVHCFAIYYSSLRDTNAVAGKVTVTDWATGKLSPVEKTTYLYSREASGRPAIKAFSEKDSATAAAVSTPGEILDYPSMMRRELSRQCGFCGRAVYETDASDVALIVMQGSCCGGARPAVVEQMFACCPMCALGVAAKLQKDMEITQKDALTGEKIYVRIMAQKVEWVQPSSAVAWSGQRKDKDGKMGSSGCFHQFVFASGENLKKWLEKHTEESGSMLTIPEMLVDMTKMTPEQMSDACKMGAAVAK
ncbi:MAG: hypothetical protein C0404_09300 [Verrucomicrobia bacterium]|nr:hypothetical protein [Verrucomicrobiota bacterium]